MDEPSLATASYDSPRTANSSHVHVLNSLHDITVCIDLDKSFDDFRWEGRGDRVLLFWKECRVLKIESGTSFRFDYLSSLIARTVTLPCDVDFSRATLALNGQQMTLQLPKTNQRVAVENQLGCEPEPAGE